MSDWIPVTERLPKDGWYLVSLGDAWSGKGDSTGRVVDPNHIYPSSVRISQMKNGYFYHGMVAAWMPLPEAYKGE